MKISDEVWQTAVLEVAGHTAAGEVTRYQGVCFVADGRAKRYANARADRLPRGARVMYRTPVRRYYGTAFEMARGRTIHHNLWHLPDPKWTDEQREKLHKGLRCTEPEI